jgi:hypothetical protein
MSRTIPSPLGLSSSSPSPCLAGCLVSWSLNVYKKTNGGFDSGACPTRSRCVVQNATMRYLRSASRRGVKWETAGVRLKWRPKVEDRLRGQNFCRGSGAKFSDTYKGHPRLSLPTRFYVITIGFHIEDAKFAYMSTSSSKSSARPVTATGEIRRVTETTCYVLSISMRCSAVNHFFKQP